MKDSPRKKRRKKPGGHSSDARQNSPAVSYTPEQQRMIRNGLRIWARVTIRSYLRQRAEDPHTETDPVAEEES